MSCFSVQESTSRESARRSQGTPSSTSGSPRRSAIGCRAAGAHWDRLPQHARPWLKGAMAYFAAADDDVPDFGSPIGFEDDCEVLNACLGWPDVKTSARTRGLR